MFLFGTSAYAQEATGADSGIEGVDEDQKKNSPVDQIIGGLDEVDDAIDEVDEIVDIAKKWVGPKPAPRRSTEFQDNQLFDMVINQSLRKKYVDVTVTETNFTTDQIPQRLDNWFNRIEKKNGTVAVCPVRESKEFLGIIDTIKTLVGVVGGLVREFDRWKTYRPAKRYHAAILIGIPEDVDVASLDAAEPRRVVGVTFYHKKKFGDLPSSCTDRSELEVSKAPTILEG